MSQQNAQKHYEPTWDSLAQYSVPTWFKDAKLGIFIHWGVYSVPAFANEWYSRNMYQLVSPEFKHHRETWGEHTQFGYKDFIPMFRAENFNADDEMTAIAQIDELCRLIKGQVFLWKDGQSWQDLRDLNGEITPA